MSKAPFDPFDERHRDKVKRRKRSEIEFEKKQWEERIDNHFRRSMDEMKRPDGEWPDYVQSNWLLQVVCFSPETNLPETVLRPHTERSMGALGYTKMLNPCAKDGRFRSLNEHFFVYRRVTAPIIGKAQLKQELGWEHGVRHRL
ncbi:MAG TPA: hypothetical protein VIY48_08950 [Candidatus Paceibacterota bacterium]